MAIRDDRREFLRLAGVSGVVFASGLAGCGNRSQSKSGDDQDFFFLQVSDTHWGYSGPKNPEAGVTLERAVAQINASTVQPDFIAFTGDLTQTAGTDSAARQSRLAGFQKVVAGLTVQKHWYLAGEHDAANDNGADFKAAFQTNTYYSFDHKGVHFVALDNVSSPMSDLGDTQLQWLSADLAALPADHPIVVLTHRPLFDLYPDWDWFTRDGAKAIDLLATKKYVTVFYGHIHQEHTYEQGGIKHYATRSLVFPHPAPGATPTPAPNDPPWDPMSQDHGLGYRSVNRVRPASYQTEPVAYKDSPAPQALSITAKMWEFNPSTIHLKVGVPVVLELTSLDVPHGFMSSSLGIDTKVQPGTPTRIPLTPATAGTFNFHCTVFCGDGHDHMAGQIIVDP